MSDEKFEFGDDVQVRDSECSTWQDAKYVGYSGSDRHQAKTDNCDVALCWYDCRKKPKKKLAPLCPEDIKPGTTIRKEGWPGWRMISYISERRVGFSFASVSYEDLMEYVNAETGEPMAKEVEDE